MAERNVIVLAGEPGGVFKEGYNASGGNILPGQFVKPHTTGVRESDGNVEYVLADHDGSSGPVIIVDYDMQGRTVEDPYADGERMFLYFPRNGEDLNVRVTGSVSPGDSLGVGGSGSASGTVTGPDRHFTALASGTNALVHSQYHD